MVPRGHLDTVPPVRVYRGVPSERLGEVGRVGVVHVGDDVVILFGATVVAVRVERCGVAEQDGGTSVGGNRAEIDGAAGLHRRTGAELGNHVADLQHPGPVVLGQI